MTLEYIRHRYRALRQAGLVMEYEGNTIKGTERSLNPKNETKREQPYYATTDRGEAVLRRLDERRNPQWEGS